MKKMSLANIKNALSRDEMKKIMAGSGCLYYNQTCKTGDMFACCFPYFCSYSGGGDINFGKCI